MIVIKSEGGLFVRKLITSKISFFKKERAVNTVKTMNYCTNQAESSQLYSDREKQKKRLQSIKKILRHFEGNKLIELVDKVPRRVIRTTVREPKELYLFNDSTADHFIDAIKDDLLADPKKIIEVNAGIGVLTEKLLEAGIQYLNVVEPDTRLGQTLVSLKKKYPKNIKIQTADLFCLWNMAGRDKHDEGNRIQQLFSDFPQIEWGDEPGLKIIGAVPNINFITYLMTDIVKQSGIASYGRPYLYLCIPPSTWLRLTCDKTAGLSQYRNTSVLFQILCDYEVLGKVPRKSFLPWKPYHNDEKIDNCSKRYLMDKDEMYIVRIEGKKNLFTELIDEKHIKFLWHFINHHMMARTGRVIPQMEVWQPGCGPKLIVQDYNIFTQFGDLTPLELVKLFNEFSSWEGFHNVFVPTFENSLQKVEQLLF